MLNRLENEMKAIETAVEGLVALEDSLKGQVGDAIRAFYAECHLPFLKFFMTFKSNYANVLTQMDSALDALEPNANGFIRETFLEGEVEEGLTVISRLTSSLTDEANDIMNQVADIVALPHLNDSDVQEGVRDARRKRDITIADLYEFDANQTRALIAIENDLSIMETWLADIESLFKEGLTGVHFESKQWAAITLNSGLQTGIDPQTSAVAGGLGNSDQDNLIGTEIKAGAFQALESKRTETIERGAYGSYNLLKFHIYENGLIIKEYQLGTRKQIQYEVVKEVEEFDDGGVRELDNYFEGTKLAFVDYIHPRAIIQKGFKKMALAIIPGVKPSKYKGNLSVKKTSAVENKSKGTGENVQDKINYPSKPHTNKTPGHWEAMIDKADELAKKDDVSKIYLNKGLSNEIPGIKPNRRPDIMVVRKDRKIDQYEVPSKTDNVEDLIERMEDNQRLLIDRAGDIFILPPKK
ncbi:LXG domain-containing protein [Sporosarcina sp. FSL K6-1540]|uniref:ribonuclease YeeF family protein n=1 Tax=Sporosarcina sp. FSL K6-1540 TaxID=2921555 RepID=UPI00315AB0DD